MAMDTVDLSRLQFATTAMYHFLFVPLTLGLSWLLFIMESVYVMTGKEIYKDMVQFWGKLFGINFAMGVATGIPLEFQFGTNWAYYSHYVGDIFGAPLAIEGLMAFFLESTFVGLFFFGWKKLTKVQHLATTFLVALGSNLSALWILIANGWMQNPVGAEFNYVTMRMELTDFAALLLNPVAQAKFIHTLSAGYTAASMFVLGVSSWYLLRGRNTGFALRSFAAAAGFGLAAILSTIVLGDESGYTTGEVQKTKLAAIEAEWHTEPAPASFTLFGFPNEAEKRTDYAVKIPYALGLIATRSLDGKVEGIDDLIANANLRIRSGMVAYDNLSKLRAGDQSETVLKAFEAHKADLGYALLLKKLTPHVLDATDAQISQAAASTIPKVAPLFWSFRLMVGLGFFFLFIFSVSFYYLIRKQLAPRRWLLHTAVWSIPLPWLAIELGWFVAEYGRQPWTISGVLPTHLSVSQLDPSQLWFSLGGFVLFYSVLLVVEMKLMLKYIKWGPACLQTGRYDGENKLGATHV